MVRSGVLMQNETWQEQQQASQRQRNCWMGGATVRELWMARLDKQQREKML